MSGSKIVLALIASSVLALEMSIAEDSSQCGSNLRRAQLTDVIMDLQRSLTALRRLEEEAAAAEISSRSCGSSSTSSTGNTASTTSNYADSDASKPDVQELQRLGYRCSENLGWHKLYLERKLWSRARRACERDGGRLAIPDSANEAQVLANWLREVEVYNAYIGIHDQFEEADWLTIAGESINKTYVRWQSGLPKAYHFYNGTQVRANCGTINHDAEFMDTQCFLKYPYICELALPPICV